MDGTRCVLPSAGATWSRPPFPASGPPKPDAFGATKEEYVAWLVGELETRAADGPIDLVGHDWGGGLVVRLVSTRPDLVRSWVTDAAGIGDPGFEWHDFAKIWQTPGDGEKFWEEQLAAPLEERGILALYRSAVDVGSEWGPAFADIPKPGLVVIASEDPFLAADGARSSAARAGATVTALEGVGHWWMLQDPARGAAMLEEFWSSLG